MRMNKNKSVYKLPNDVVRVNRVILRKGKYYYHLHLMPYLEAPKAKDIATPTKCAFMGGYLHFDTYPPQAWSFSVDVDRRDVL